MNCSRVNPHCAVCRNQRGTGTTSQLVCSSCETGYRLRRDGSSKICDCAPGLAMDANKNCQPCSIGNYCPGGDASLNPNNEEADCPDGLATTFMGAKSQAQCFTQPGYGRVSVQAPDGHVTLEGVLCEVGTYNIGGNTAVCQNCGPGLTTARNGSTSASACQAPAGSKKDKGIGKLCKRGTYTTEVNSNTTCASCPEGITTADEGSTSPDDCALAQKGYYINPNDATEALECPQDTYQDQEAYVTSCTPCPNGWKTEDTGATGVPLCLAPPGFELLPNASAITPCPLSSYKTEWNRNGCIQCGSGLITKEEGSVSNDACLIPAGWGLTSMSPVTAAPCEKNTFGDDTSRVVASDARCNACPGDTYTLDTLENRNRSSNELYTSDADCLVKPGWGTTSTIPQECPVGTYNEGKNRLPCKQCGTGWTTVSTGRTSESQCVIQAGWKMGADGIPDPCDKGSFSTGGTEAAPNATCILCPNGWTTQTDEATREAECAVCAPGYGGSGCAQCGYGTYAAGGSSPDVACVACAAGSTSRKGASQSQQCHSTLIDARFDVFRLADEAAWSGIDAATGPACGAACTDSVTCVMYKFVASEAGQATGRCSLLNEVTASPSHTVGFKIGNGDEYSVWGLTQSVGAALARQPSGVADEAACKDVCTAASECEVYVWQSGGSPECTLAASELEDSAISMFQVRGDHLFSDLHP
uniref:Tyrosine-protein kinase ephrin type A/B receptor-like domain-containing protein n=1 Tax=Tetradesmus obliquus TaxID=3088 RepID=A0A383VRV3_TETOB|eukprot:jgi/Sobl393_1/17107/SZX68248.1